MEKKTLYRYFEGIASREEEEAVYRWLDATPANEKELLREREFFDAMILAGSAEDVKGKEEGEQKRKRSGFRIHSFVREMLKVAAVVAITVACGLYFYVSEKKGLLL